MADEREAKLLAPADFVVPDLDDVGTGLSVSPVRRQRMRAVYFDTADLALARAGLTLRHRTGEPGDPWTVKLGGSASGSELVRREVTFADGPMRVPAGAADLVRAHVRGRSLVPVARLRTVRTLRELRNAAGDVVVAIADDRVTAYAGAARIARFRELEAELKTDADDESGVLDAVVAELVADGATADPPMSKLVRALGSAAQAPPDVVVGDVGERSDARDFVRHVIAGSVARMLAQDPALRLGAAESDIHAFRVATRRLRSDLRTFRPLLEPEWVRSRRDELGWIADVVGAVRDTDVLRARLREHVSGLGPDAAGAHPLLAVLASQRESAHGAMLVALRSPRYDALIDALIAASAEPMFAGAADVAVPARTVVASLVRRSWKQLRREVRRAGKHPSDEQLHDIRIVAKRARYAAEAASKVFGKRAGRFAAAIADAQTVLGDHHDAHVAEQWLRDATGRVEEGAGGAGLAAGLMVVRERRERTRLAREWRAVWKKASAAKLRRWF